MKSSNLDQVREVQQRSEQSDTESVAIQQVADSVIPSVSKFQSGNRQFGVSGIVLDIHQAQVGYQNWTAPECIVVDCAFPPHAGAVQSDKLQQLRQWYAPHVSAWHQESAANCTVWLIADHLTWQAIHSVFDSHGWDFQQVFTLEQRNLSAARAASSRNQYASEIVVRYCKRRVLSDEQGQLVTEKVWLRSQWRRSDMDLKFANIACGVSDIATRHYLSQGDLWSRPTGDAVARMAAHCATHAPAQGIPYFSMDQRTPFSAAVWDAQLPIWNAKLGIANVWNVPPLSKGERIAGTDGKALDARQRPVALMRTLIELSTNPGDVVWEPFAGLCSAAVAALDTGRRAFSSAPLPVHFDAALRRLITPTHVKGLVVHAGENTNDALRPKESASIARRAAAVDVVTLPLFPEIDNEAVPLARATGANDKNPQSIAMGGFRA